MFYESVEHNSITVASALEAAKAVKGIDREKVAAYTVVEWTNKGQSMAVCSDVHVDDPAWAETAVFKKVDGKYYQVESISVNRCSVEETTKYFEECEPEDISKNSPAQLIIGEADEDKKAWFECGCCGSSFQDSIKFQKQFDQDTGFGICKENGCQKHYL
jgi:hypothetical protein